MIKKVFVPVLLLFSGLAIIPSACVNNNEEDLYGDVLCDTTDLTWQSDIAEILEVNCVSCHGPQTSYKGVRHDSYTSERTYIDDGRLRAAINHDSGIVPMPYGQPKLDDCTLQKINTWLDNGAPEK